MGLTGLVPIFCIRWKSTHEAAKEGGGSNGTTKSNGISEETNNGSPEQAVKREDGYSDTDMMGNAYAATFREGHYGHEGKEVVATNTGSGKSYSKANTFDCSRMACAAEHRQLSRR